MENKMKLKRKNNSISHKSSKSGFVHGLFRQQKNKVCTYFHRCDGPVVRASASQSEGHGFEPRPSHTKDFKNGTHCLLVWRSINEKGLGKLNTQSYQWTSPLL